MSNVENTQWIKEQLYDEFVEYRVSKFAQSRDGQYCDAKIVIKNQQLSRYIKNKRKSITNMNDNDYISECALIIYSALEKFEHPDLEGIYTGENKKGYNQLIKFIKKSLHFRLMDMQHPNSTHTTVTVSDGEGGTHSVKMYVNAIVESADALVEPSDGGCESKTTLIETMCSDNNYLSEREGYEMNAFRSYFEENKHRILKPAHIELLETLAEHNYSLEDKKTRELAEAGVPVKSLAGKLRRIQKKVADSYTKEKKFYGMTFVERMLQKRIGLLRTMLSIVNSDDVENMNDRLSKAIIGNIDAEVVMHILDELDAESYKEVVFAVQHKLPIISEVLYKIVVLMEAELERLEIALVQEQAMKQALAEEKGVVVSKEFIVPKEVSTIYVTVTSTGAIVNPKWAGMEQE